MTHTSSLCRILEFTFHLKFWKIRFLFHILWHTLSRLEASKFAIDSSDCFEIFLNGLLSPALVKFQREICILTPWLAIEWRHEYLCWDELSTLKLPQLIVSNILFYSDYSWASSRLKTSATHLFVQTSKKENMKDPHYWHFARGNLDSGWISSERASNTENVSMFWRVMGAWPIAVRVIEVLLLSPLGKQLSDIRRLNQHSTYCDISRDLVVHFRMK